MKLSQWVRIWLPVPLLPSQDGKPSARPRFLVAPPSKVLLRNVHWIVGAGAPSTDADESLPSRICIDVLSPSATRHQFSLGLNFQPEGVNILLGDAHRLGQVLYLIGNAIKFTSADSIDLAVTVLAQRPGHINLHFAVRDTGIRVNSGPGVGSEFWFSVPYKFVEGDRLLGDSTPAQTARGCRQHIGRPGGCACRCLGRGAAQHKPIAH